MLGGWEKYFTNEKNPCFFKIKITEDTVHEIRSRNPLHHTENKNDHEAFEVLALHFQQTG
jgi:hypothetical protein